MMVESTQLILKPGVSYDTIRDRLHTGDLILFKGSDFVSRFITSMQDDYIGANMFSHAGMIIRAADLPVDSKFKRDNDGQTVYVLESTASGHMSSDGVPSAMNGATFVGVQLRNFDLVVRAYDTPSVSRMAWLPLKPSNRDKISPNALDRVLSTYVGLAYDANVVDLFAALSPCARAVRDTWLFRKIRRCCALTCGCFCCCSRTTSRRWLFCSELVAQVYKDFGILAPSVNPENVVPCDFLPLEFEVDENTPRSPPKSPVRVYDADNEIPWLFEKVERFHF